MQALDTYFKSIVDQDGAPVVVCDTAHTIIYMNPAAVSAYSDRGGKELVGRSLLDCHSPRSCEAIKKVVEWFSRSRYNNKVHTYYSRSKDKDVYMIALRDESGALIGYYEKHEFRTKDETPFYDIGQA